MKGRYLLLFILFRAIKRTDVFDDQKDRTSSRSGFFATYENKQLHGHIVKSFESPSLLSCSLLCARTAWCTSTNLKLSSKNGGKGTCELNKHDVSMIKENANFQEKEGVTFAILSQIPCQGNPCKNNGACVPKDFERNTYHCVCRPGFAGTHCEACKFDFENGIDGWDKTGTVFNNQPTYGDNPTARKKGQPANQQGDWWIGGAENRPSKSSPAGKTQEDGPQGTLTSRFFNIKGETISFLIGGGCDIHTVRAELVINNQAVKHETGDCNESMTRKIWDVAAFIGQRARVRLIDVSSDSWGHINFDDLKGNITCDQD